MQNVVIIFKSDKFQIHKSINKILQPARNGDCQKHLKIKFPYLYVEKTSEL